MSDITESMAHRKCSSTFMISARKSERKRSKIYRNTLIFVEIIFGQFIRTYPINAKKDEGVFKVLRSRTVNYIDHNREKTIKAIKLLAKQVII